ncbi:MAG: L,D-transpeptidase family protein [Longimicrobiales bacterium]
MSWHRDWTAPLLTMAVMSACGGGPEEQPRDRIRAWLRAASGARPLPLAGGDTVHVSKATVEFYRTRRWQPAWSNEKELLPTGVLLRESIGRARDDGLAPHAYGHDVTSRLLGRLEAEGEDELPDSLEVPYLASVDILLTEGYNRYANDLVRGRLDPNQGGPRWRIARGKARESRVLQLVLEGLTPAEVVAHLRPSIPYYERVRGALAKHYHVAAQGGWPKVPEGSVKVGQRSPAVSLARTRLISGLDDREALLAQMGAADPTLFDAELAKAVEYFQLRHAIEPDGALGAATVREMNHSVEERISELELNLDRWRWLSDDLGERYLLVNIAGFELEVVDHNRAIESMNVVVGKRNWQTPVFADTIEHIVVNPYWNVPPSIYNEEILPKIESDPTWLARNNYERVREGVRQKPGPGNALGNYKFVFPNEDDIYLHDTPADHLFSRTRRDFSHGCIRVERPADLARLLVRLQTDQDPNDLEKLVSRKRESWIKLTRPLPIYILYFTVWVEEDGTVRYHHDIYGRDEQLQSQQRGMAAQDE